LIGYVGQIHFEGRLPTRAKGESPDSRGWHQLSPKRALHRALSKLSELAPSSGRVDSSLAVTHLWLVMFTNRAEERNEHGDKLKIES
jgi:hypothetical protein